MTRRLYIKVSPLGVCFIINRPYLPFLAMLNLRQRLIVNGEMTEEGGSWRFRDINATYFRVCSKLAATLWQQFPNITPTFVLNKTRCLINQAVFFARPFWKEELFNRNTNKLNWWLNDLKIRSWNWPFLAFFLFYLHFLNNNDLCSSFCTYKPVASLRDIFMFEIWGLMLKGYKNIISIISDWNLSKVKRIFFSKWNQLEAHYFLVHLLQLLYMFRAAMCPSPEELTVSMWHWYFSLCMVCWLGWVLFQPADQTETHHNQQTRQPPIQSEKYQCRIDAVSSLDNGHIVARNM